ncbi:putative meiosis-specific protein SPO11 like protein [Dictyocoela muelleri]|nr:putative meiosis-specific protein SPO11 like protein [Dictyocoela muelleri]
MKQIIEKIKQETRSLITKKKYKNLTEKLKINEKIIELISTNTTMKSREIYYQSPNIFKKQSRVNYFLNQICKSLKVTLKDLNVLSSTKGVFIGKIVFYYHNGKSEILFSGLIPDMDLVRDFRIFHKNILVVEKDCLLSFIYQSVKSEYLLVSGKGYPCKNTIRFLERLQNLKVENNNEYSTKCKIFGLFDLDPSGLHIYKIYKSGSIKNPHSIEIKRIGLTSNDVYKYKIDESELIDLSRRDIVLLETLINYDVDQEFKEDIMFLKGLSKKMEIEIIINNSRNLTKEYLIEKIILERDKSVIKK